ncbi:MAG: AEC family transporter [Lachnospiraceae bacterium]|jgi:predicted permease
MIAVTLARQLAELFIMMMLGTVLVRAHLCGPDAAKGLSVICIYVILPCVILEAFQISYTDEIRDGFLLALLAAFLIHLILFILTALLGKVFPLDRIEKASLIYSNAGNLIVPLVTSVLGKEWVIYASAFITVQNLFVWTHGTSLISGRPQFSLKKILTNVNMIAVVIGLLMFFFQLHFPSVISDVTHSIASSVGPVSMIMIGIILGGASWRKIFGSRRIYFICLLKLIVIPLIVLLFLKYSGLASLVPDGRTILMISLLAVITPSASTVTQLAQLYDQEPSYAGAINALTTIFCIVTMPAMVFLYNL